MTPQPVDHAHTDSCIVIGCNLVQPGRNMNMLISGCSQIAAASQWLHSHSCEQRFSRLTHALTANLGVLELQDQEGDPVIDSKVSFQSRPQSLDAAQNVALVGYVTYTVFQKSDDIFIVNSMLSRVYVTVGCPSVCLTHRSTEAAACNWFAAERPPQGQEISIDSCRRPRSAANAGSVLWRAEERRSTQTS